LTGGLPEFGTAFGGSFRRIVQSPGGISIFYDVGQGQGWQRNIVMNGSPHLPANIRQWYGDSRGHWEGDTLVVDTIGFNDKSWLPMTMQPHSEDTRLIERIRHITTPSGAYMEVRGKIEDRQALTSAFEYSRYYKQSSEEMVPNVCSEDIGTWKDIRDRHLRPLMERAREVK